MNLNVAQNLTALIDDLKTVGKKIFFWNWKLETTHAVLRHNTAYLELFKSSGNLKELIEGMQSSNGKVSEVVS